MSEKATSSYECLAKDESHTFDYASLQNVYEVQDEENCSEN